MVQVQNGGCKPTYPRHVGNSLLDVAHLNRQVEATEAEIRKLIQKRDRLQRMVYRRLAVLSEDTVSHETAIQGRQCAVCRAGSQQECSWAELWQQCGQKVEPTRGNERALIGA